MRIFQQPLREVTGSIVILKISRKFPSIGIFIIEPGVSYGKYSSLPNFGNRHDVVTGVGEDSFGGTAQLQGTLFFYVNFLSCIEYSILYCHGEGAHLILTAGNFVVAVEIEVHAKVFREMVEMGKFAIGGIVAHQHQYATGLHPVVNGPDVGIRGIMRVDGLFFVVGVGNDIYRSF